MTLTLDVPAPSEMKPKIIVFGVGGAGGNVVNNMIESKLDGVEFVVANTDSQALQQSNAERKIQIGANVTEGLGAGSNPQIGRAAAEETIDEIRDHLSPAHMVFITLGMGGGTGTGAGPIIAKVARDMGILTVGVVTKPFEFEGMRRQKIAEKGIHEFAGNVDTLIIIPNQNLFRIADDKTKFTDAFAMADKVLRAGVASITELMTKEGLINLDFADVRAIMGEMGRAMMGTGEASGDKRAIQAAEAAISNPLLDETSMCRAKGLLISITGDSNLTLFEVDEAVRRIRKEVSEDANIIVGAAYDDELENLMRVSVVATGISAEENENLYQDNQIFSDKIENPHNQQENQFENLKHETPTHQHIDIRHDTHDNNETYHALKNKINEIAEIKNEKINTEETQQKNARLPEIKDFPPIAQMEIAAKRATENQQNQNNDVQLKKQHYQYSEENFSFNEPTHNPPNFVNAEKKQNQQKQNQQQENQQKESQQKENQQRDYSYQNVKQNENIPRGKNNASLLQRLGFGAKKYNNDEQTLFESGEQKSLTPKLPPINESKNQENKLVQNNQQDQLHDEDLEIPTFLRKHSG